MARKLKIVEDEELLKKKETIYSIATRDEKQNWRRKYREMQRIIKELVPFEKEILKLVRKKQKVEERLVELRVCLHDECIHPVDELVYDKENDTFSCKFCEKRLKLNERV